STGGAVTGGGRRGGAGGAEPFAELTTRRYRAPCRPVNRASRPCFGAPGSRHPARLARIEPRDREERALFGADDARFPRHHELGGGADVVRAAPRAHHDRPGSMTSSPESPVYASRLSGTTKVTVSASPGSRSRRANPMS